MTQPESYQEDAASAIVKQLAAVQDSKALLLERESALKTALRDLLGEGKHTAGGLTVSIIPNRRFDPSAAAAVYPEKDYPEMYTLALDPKKARNFIPPADYDALMCVVGDPRVSLK